MNNNLFLEAINNSFQIFLEHWSRSSKKLEVLHWFIAKNLIEELNKEWDYKVQSLGLWNSKEWKIQWRYINKNVDITIYNSNDKPIAGVWVKFVMQNYSQNSNNYFENMLWETANIRCNNIPYYQIFIVFEKMPYYDKSNSITKWELFSEINWHKYQVLSQDNSDSFLHTPNKTLLFLIKIKDDVQISNKEQYINAYKWKNNCIILSNTIIDFQENIIYNDYGTFIKKLIHWILSK